MKSTIYKSETRGRANHGWLDARHNFSFAGYIDRERMHFGALRVLNDDIVAPGTGFGTHPHDNMEIITIPLEGELTHKDSMGNTGVIHRNEVQVMSAGTGILHSEYNNHETDRINLFQIWIYPREKNLIPRYDQRKFDLDDKINELMVLVSPNEEEALMINQDAWLSMGKFDKDYQSEYKIRKPGNGAFVMVVSGSFEIDGNVLESRDAIGIWDADNIRFTAKTDKAEILIIDVPMEF